MTPPNGLVRHSFADRDNVENDYYLAADVEVWADEILLIVDQHSKEEALVLMQQAIAHLKGTP